MLIRLTVRFLLFSPSRDTSRHTRVTRDSNVKSNKRIALTRGDSRRLRLHRAPHASPPPVRSGQCAHLPAQTPDRHRCVCACVCCLLTRLSSGADERGELREAGDLPDATSRDTTPPPRRRRRRSRVPAAAPHAHHAPERRVCETETDHRRGLCEIDTSILLFLTCMNEKIQPHHRDETSRSRGLELKEILLVQQRVPNTLVVGPAANLRAVGEQVLLDKLAIDAR